MNQFKCDAAEAILSIAIRLQSEAAIHNEVGDADCGTGSDVPYALARLSHSIASELELLAYKITEKQ